MQAQSPNALAIRKKEKLYMGNGGADESNRALDMKPNEDFCENCGTTGRTIKTLPYCVEP
jgi:hypothetical protein